MSKLFEVSKYPKPGGTHWLNHQSTRVFLIVKTNLLLSENLKKWNTNPEILKASTIDLIEHHIQKISG